MQPSLKTYLGISCAAIAVITVAGVGMNVRFSNADSTTDDLSLLEVTEVVELGDVAYGAAVAYEAVVRNTSKTSTVRIENLDSSCSCTTVTQGPIEIGPGESVPLKGVANVSEDMAFTSGTVASLWFESGEGSRRTIELRASNVAPVAESAIDVSDNGAVFTISEMYRPLIQDVLCFLEGVRDRLESEFSHDGMSVRVKVPDDAESLEVVFVLRDPNDENGRTYRVVQDVPIARTPSEVAVTD